MAREWVNTLAPAIARRTRREIGAQRYIRKREWETALVFGVITQIAVARAHLDSRQAQLAALTVFSLAAVSTLALVAMFDSTFGPPFSLGAAPIADVLTLAPEAWSRDGSLRQLEFDVRAQCHEHGVRIAVLEKWPHRLNIGGDMEPWRNLDIVESLKALFVMSRGRP